MVSIAYFVQYMPVLPPDQKHVRQALQFLGPEALADILLHATLVKVPAGEQLLREGQYVRVIPIVLKGLMKVSTGDEDRELLLYYIQPGESCIMSLSACLMNHTSRVGAITQDETEVLLIPVDKLQLWLKSYPNFYIMFFNLFNQRYTDLLDTIRHLVFDNLDERIYHYCQQKLILTGHKYLKLSHRQIAQDLGTAREVVSRVIKKLEKNNRIKQSKFGIEVI